MKCDCTKGLLGKGHDGWCLSRQPDPRLHVPLARVLLERAQDGYVNPTGGKTTGRERKDA